LLSGRGFTAADRADVALVNEPLAREMVSEGTPPLGRTIELRQGTDEDAPRLQVTIVGVITATPRSVSDVDPDAAVYVPLTVAPPAPWLVVRTTDTEALTTAIRQWVTSIEPRLPWIPVERADVTYLREAEPLTYIALSLAAFGGIALTLAAVGLFAMMTYVVSLRTRELGIRVALGARSGDVVGLVVRQAMRIAAYGSVAGMAIAVPIGFALRAALPGISPFDPLALAPTLALLFVVAIAAAAVPARRAARVDPVTVLRDL
jgi:MacB-like periplasmic core domain/FtsX-like permease family